MGNGSRKVWIFLGKGSCRDCDPWARGGRGQGGRGLEVWAEVFDDALFFFGGALVVEGDEVLEELVVGEGGGPAVGVEDGGVEFVVELFVDGDEAVVVDGFVLGGELGGGDFAAVGGAEFFEDVVHVGEGEVGEFCCCRLRFLWAGPVFKG